MSTEDEQEEDSAHEQHYLDVKAAFERVDLPDNSDVRDTLAEAMYAGSELGVFSIDDIDVEAALEIWRAVESVRQHGFPTELRM